MTTPLSTGRGGLVPPLSRYSGRGVGGEGKRQSSQRDCRCLARRALTPDPSPGVPGEGRNKALTPDPSPGVPGEGRKTALTPDPSPGVPGEGAGSQLLPRLGWT